MVSIARQILMHDRLRFSITVISLGFAMVMIIYDLGMFLSVTGDSVSVVKHAQADTWVSQAGEGNLLSGSQVPVGMLENIRYARGKPGLRTGLFSRQLEDYRIPPGADCCGGPGLSAHSAVGCGSR